MTNPAIMAWWVGGYYPGITHQTTREVFQLFRVFWWVVWWVPNPYGIHYPLPTTLDRPEVPVERGRLPDGRGHDPRGTQTRSTHTHNSGHHASPIEGGDA